MNTIKKILVPTDFSVCATHALQFAAMLAQKSKATITLLHSYQPMAAFTAVGFYQPAYMMEDIENNARQQLEELAGKHLGNKDITYTITTRAGFAVESIEEACLLYDIDLVVMGTKGANGIEEIFGSNTASIINRSQCLVIAVPEGWPVKEFKNIVLAINHATPVPKLNVMLELARLFRAEIHVLYVAEQRDAVRTGGAKQGIKLEQQLKGLPHSYCVFEHEDVEEGITTYAQNHAADLIVLNPQKHSLFERLFKGSITRQMAYHTTIPLLTLSN